MLRRSVPIVAALAFMPMLASADGWVEVVVGAAVPVADSDYTDRVDNSPTAGLRVGGDRDGVGAEVAIDYTPIDIHGSSTFAGVEFSAWRTRALVAARVIRPIGRKAVVFARAGAGVDLANISASGSFLGVNVDQSETDTGLALEVGVGIGVTLDPVLLGVQLGVPIGLHFNDDDPNDPNDFDFEYTAVDLQVLFAVGTRF
jgi:opacity protein-like surface antigen